MDWSRIKTILIGVLLVTNILLGLTFYQRGVRFEQERQERLERVLALMNQKQIYLRGDDLTFPSYLNSIEVSYESITESILIQLLGNEYETTNNQYRNGLATVTQSEMGLFYEKYPTPSAVYDDVMSGIPIEDADNIALLDKTVTQFLSEYGFSSDYMIEEHFLRGSYQIVTASQIYRDYIMDDAKMTFVIVGDEVVSFRRIWLEINTDIIPTKYDIITLDRALYVTLPKLRSGDIINDISISYKLNDSSSVVGNLVSGEALPYYRIEVQDEDVYYIRAIVEE
jgi:regulatory protein YycI of two-component signal transduction system YycFG